MYLKEVVKLDFVLAYSGEMVADMPHGKGLLKKLTFGISDNVNCRQNIYCLNPQYFFVLSLAWIHYDTVIAIRAVALHG